MPLLPRSTPLFAPIALLLLLSTTTTTLVRADAIGPPPSNCRRGTVPVSDHGGSRCEPEAPKNCPAGWGGIVGGKCILHQCVNDSACESAPGTKCVAVDLCIEQRPMYWEYQRGGANSQKRSNLLAEPPPAPDPAHPVDVAVDVCGANGACKEPATCKAGKKLCLPPNTAAAPEPPNAVVTSGNVPPVAASSASSGCAGCTTTATTTTVAASTSAALLACFLGFILVKRRQRPRA